MNLYLITLTRKRSEDPEDVVTVSMGGEIKVTGYLTDPEVHRFVIPAQDEQTAMFTASTLGSKLWPTKVSGTDYFTEITYLYMINLEVSLKGML